MKRRILIVGTILMLFLGLIYAWSLFAAPLEEAFNWSRSQTSTTFSISMITFCLGSIASGILLRKRSPGNILLISAILFLGGFYWASRITSIWELYISYGVFCGFGVGLSYNAILSTVPKWYPSRGGFATGTLLMGMGLGSLILGIAVKRIMDALVWVRTFKLLAITFFVIFAIGSFMLMDPEIEGGSTSRGTNQRNYKLLQMLKTVDFWMLFGWATIVSSIGLALVSNASYMAAEVGVSEFALPLIVGMVSIGNGLGRLIFGAITDKFGGKKAMFTGNLVFIVCLLLIMMANKFAFILYIGMGFILGGIGYGASPTLSAALTKHKFGEKYFPQNLSAIVLALIPASLIGPTISAGVYQHFGHYMLVYYIMLAMALLAFLPVIMYRE